MPNPDMTAGELIATGREDIHTLLEWLDQCEWRRGDGMVSARLLALFSATYDRSPNRGLNPYQVLDYQRGEEAEASVALVLKRAEQMAHYLGAD
jgi:hypothetical protein